jgi:hypothetical protein
MKLKKARASMLCALLQKWNAITSVAQIAQRPNQKRFSTRSAYQLAIYDGKAPKAIRNHPPEGLLTSLALALKADKLPSRVIAISGYSLWREGASLHMENRYARNQEMVWAQRALSSA